MLFRVALCSLLGLVVSFSALAQSPRPYVAAEASELRIDGDSNKSAWTVYARGFDGTLQIVPGDVPALAEARFVIQAGAVTSDKSVIMDRNMHNALEVDVHPEIVYHVTEASSEPADGGFTVRARGTLTLHGQARPVELTLAATPDGEGYRFRGEHTLDMTSYRIKPPVAAFGAWRVAKEVTVHIDVLAEPAG